jgi:hypothetical protein
VGSAPSADYFSFVHARATLSSMRAHWCFGLTLLGAFACAPLAAIPLQAAMRGPQALAAPMEDGSVYVLAEGGPTTSNATLRTLWRREAAKACAGEYMVMSEQDSQSRSGGVVRGGAHEGYVRCVSAEGMGIDPDRS